ncbi:bile acid:sodium symporter, partial [Candidatus Uhrbacteria bacterium]|nr:bile acid:sodium symporter [Candidatus Uhrbacteria bacterium]
MTLLARLRHFVMENQIMVVFFGILAGFLFPAVFKPIAAYGSFLLMLIFFTSSLRLSLEELADYAKDWRMVLLTTLFMLVFLPVAMWLPPRIFAPDWALPFLIVGAMPTGMTIALIADYFGGRASLAIMIVIVTSLFAPFSIPFVMELTVGRAVEIDASGMFRSLAQAIILPFLASWAVQRAAGKAVKRRDALWRTLSIAAFGVLIASIVSKTVGDGSDGAFESLLSLESAVALAAGFAVIVGVTWLSYRVSTWKSVPERVTIALCMVYMNFTLSLYV